MTHWYTTRDRQEHVLEHVSPNEPLTVMQISSRAFGADAWKQRGNIRNDLYVLEAAGLIEQTNDRPMRFTRVGAPVPVPAREVDPWVDRVAEAICKADLQPSSWLLYPQVRDKYRKLATAALKALGQARP